MKNRYFKIVICCFFLFMCFNQFKVYAATGTILTSAGGTLSTGTYYLNSDLTISDYLLIKSGVEVVLDLNGHVLKHSGNERVLVINVGGKVTIVDSEPTRSHYGTVKDGLWTYDATATSGTEINGGIITGGLTSDRGGAIYNSGTLIMESGTIAGCKSLSNGNANENENNIETHPVNTITNGVGGAVFVNEEATFTMNDGAIMYCKAGISSSVGTSGGGAVFIDANANKAGVFTMNAGTISNCSATSGGAVFVHSNISTGNTTKEAGKFYMNGGEIKNCSSTHSSSHNDVGGGAVFINATASEDNSIPSIGLFELSNGIIKNNTTNGNGGAVYSYGKFIMSDEAKLLNNTTLNTAQISTDGKLIYKGVGGSVFIYTENAEFIMNDGIISESIAASGGGVMVYTDATFTMNNGEISNCKSLGSGGMGNGGAVYVQASTFNFNDGILKGNWARRYGGAININQSAKLYLNGKCEVISNEANHGGGISQEAGDCQIQLDNENVLIKGNKAVGSSSNGNGGGLFIEKGTLNISAGTIIENIAANNGGGISLRVERIGGDITVNMTGGTLEGNTAGVDGGALDIFADYTFTETETTTDSNRKNDVVVNLKNGILDSNNADKNGGAINVSVNEDNGTALINIGDEEYTSPKLCNNMAEKNGGTICINNGSVNMLKGIIDNSSASKGCGGAIYILGGDFVMEGGKIGDFENGERKGCRATKGGAIYVTGGNFTLNAGEIIGNTATDSGGGIQISDGNVYIAGGSIKYNLARGENENAGYGGGIFVDGGERVRITGGEISYNIAAKNGGGIEIKTDKNITVDINSGKFLENMAEEAGGAVGVDCTNGVINVGKEGCDGLKTSDHEHPIILDNIAGVTGGGFYTTGTNAILNIYCGTIDNNLVNGIESNFEQTNGTVTVYPNVKIGDSKDGIIVIGGTFIDLSLDNGIRNEIVYYSNFEGNTDCKSATITADSEVTLPGNIFGISDYRVIGWSEIPNNVGEIDYELGEKILLNENKTLYAIWDIEVNEPTFLVVIPSEVKLDKYNEIATIEVEATISFFPRTKFLKVTLKEDDFTLSIKKDNIKIDTIPYSVYKDDEKITSTVILELYSETKLLEYNETTELTIEAFPQIQYAGKYEDSMTFEVEVVDI